MIGVKIVRGKSGIIRMMESIIQQNHDYNVFDTTWANKAAKSIFKVLFESESKELKRDINNIVA